MGQYDQKLIFLKSAEGWWAMRQRRSLPSLQKKPAASELNIWHIFVYAWLLCCFLLLTSWILKWSNGSWVNIHSLQRIENLIISPLPCISTPLISQNLVNGLINQYLNDYRHPSQNSLAKIFQQEFCMHQSRRLSWLLLKPIPMCVGTSATDC